MSDTPSLTPPPEADPLVPGPATSAFDRARARKAALQARAEEVAKRVEAARADHKTLDAGFEAVARDVEVGGGIIAGALAYRFFIWLLPLALLALGIVAWAPPRADTGQRLGVYAIPPALVTNYDVLGAYPHDTMAFIEGLVWYDGGFYESDGLFGESSLRRVAYPSGEVVKKIDVPREHFAEGLAMVGDKLRRFRIDCGLSDAIQQGIGYLTFAMLAAIAERLHLHPQFVPSRGPIGWRLRRSLARLRLRRAPAAFGLWVAR